MACSFGDESYSGGVLRINYGNLYIENTLWKSNIAFRGSAIYAAISNGVNLYLRNSQFDGNSCIGSDGCNNQCNNQGTIILEENLHFGGVPYLIENVEFTSNSACYPGAPSDGIVVHVGNDGGGNCYASGGHWCHGNGVYSTFPCYSLPCQQPGYTPAIFADECPGGFYRKNESDSCSAVTNPTSQPSAQPSSNPTANPSSVPVPSLSWEPCTSESVNPNLFPLTSMNFTLDDRSKSCQLSMTGVSLDVLAKIRKVTVKLMHKEENKQYMVHSYRSPESPIAFPVTLSLSGLDFEYTKAKVSFRSFKDPETKKHGQLFCAFTKM